MIYLDYNNNYACRGTLARLKQRVAGNYANFKAEMLSLCEEEIYDNAQRIAIVKDVYEQITSNELDYMEQSEAEYLLRFYDPLEMIADYMEQVSIGEYSTDIDEAFIELMNDDKASDKYLTVSFAAQLAEKHGEHTPMQISLLQETIEAGEQYIRLLKLTHKVGTDDADIFASPFTIMGFDEDGFFIYEDEDNKEGCF